MSRFLSTVLLLLLLAPLAAQPRAPLLERLLEIAEPDQVQAFSRLELSGEQEQALMDLARGYLPEIQKQKGQPARLLPVLGEALTRADTILTPRQRPLARTLLPRPHQWKELQRLAQEFF